MSIRHKRLKNIIKNVYYTTNLIFFRVFLRISRAKLLIFIKGLVVKERVVMTVCAMYATQFADKRQAS